MKFRRRHPKPHQPAAAPQSPSGPQTSRPRAPSRLGPASDRDCASGFPAPVRDPGSPCQWVPAAGRRPAAGHGCWVWTPWLLVHDVGRRYESIFSSAARAPGPMTRARVPPGAGTGKPTVTLRLTGTVAPFKCAKPPFPGRPSS